MPTRRRATGAGAHATWAAVVLLASAVGGIGCQVIAGIAGLRVDEGTGGAAGHGGSSSSAAESSSTGATGGGDAGCVSASECGTDTECQTWECEGGSCVPTNAPATTKCGDATEDECNKADSCDGAGNCAPNHEPTSTPCGDPSEDDCDLADSCDGAGKCAANLVANGTSCGSKCVGEMTTGAGTCNAGVCSATTQPCPQLYACNEAGTACNTSCTMASQCASNAFCGFGPMMCIACGMSAPPASCAGCEGCTANTCITTCDSPDECTSNVDLDTGMVAKRLLCGDQCNGITVSCHGPRTCEVVCESGGCQDLTLTCASDTICKLTCNGTGCAGAVTMSCGDNACNATCADAKPINQMCNGSCGCTKTGCT